MAWGDPEYGGVLPYPHPQKVRRIESTNGSAGWISKFGIGIKWGIYIFYNVLYLILLCIFMYVTYNIDV